jgi:uncharacterized hydrophobic protein (TIGR00271 family)
MDKDFWAVVKRMFRQYISLADEIDTESAAIRIKNGIWFRGPNVWILAFAIVLASVGLNVNSTAVIIGAMLVSPLMGPIIGVGLSFGTSDVELLKSAAKNLLLMVVISLFASTLYFVLTPLALVNPTELLARTSPTIYDVLIAFFGGLAGILENSRKERGTVLSGVAIATALMPPLCTAGYGLAHLNFHYFFGALYLFLINSVFIALATYLMVKYLQFEPAQHGRTEVSLRRKRIVTFIFILFLVPSIWSAFRLITENNFERNASDFVENNRIVGPHSYVYDYDVTGHSVTIAIAGEPLTDSLKNVFLDKADAAGVNRKYITLLEHYFGMSQEQMNDMIDEIYSRTDVELAQNAALMELMQSRLDSLALSLDALRSRTDSLQLQLDATTALDLEITPETEPYN